jgi:DNA repair photolyase
MKMDIELTHVRNDKMFSFVNCWWNPITGCLHNCSYCWARKKAKYRNNFAPTFHPRALGHIFKPNTVVFVVSEGDIFTKGGNLRWVYPILDKIRQNPQTIFLTCTKNPEGYLEVESDLPDNLIAGATIESDTSLALFSKAPSPQERFRDFNALRHNPKLLVAEPVIDFNLELYSRYILQVMPKWFAIGYDNYDNRLPEPSREKVEILIRLLESSGIIVFRKTIREANGELGI